jgi:hypothetical protein
LRTTETAEASLADILLRNRLGMAMLAMIKIIATTISNSISENPFLLRLGVMFVCPAVPLSKLLVHHLSLELSAARQVPSGCFKEHLTNNCVFNCLRLTSRPHLMHQHLGAATKKCHIVAGYAILADD